MKQDVGMEPPECQFQLMIQDKRKHIQNEVSNHYVGLAKNVVQNPCKLQQVYHKNDDNNNNNKKQTKKKLEKAKEELKIRRAFLQRAPCPQEHLESLREVFQSLGVTED